MCRTPVLDPICYSDSTMKFRIGDLVQLKSGGPSMTVAYLPRDQPNRCRCTWVDDKHNLQEEFFNFDELKIYEEYPS